MIVVVIVVVITVVAIVVVVVGSSVVVVVALRLGSDPSGGLVRGRDGVGRDGLLDKPYLYIDKYYNK